MATELLRAENIVKTFGPTKALQGVDFTLHAGEIRGLIGENGSGKSTLCSVCGGIYGCDSGELFLKGEPYHPTSMVDAQKKGFAQILQEMGTISGIKVADNIFIGKEKLFTKGGLVNRKAMYKAAKEVLASLGVEDIDPKAQIDTLNFEDRKLVEIARAMYDQPDILVVDETTTALSQKGRDILRFCRNNLAVWIFLKKVLRNSLQGAAAAWTYPPASCLKERSFRLRPTSKSIRFA